MEPARLENRSIIIHRSPFFSELFDQALCNAAAWDESHDLSNDSLDAANHKPEHVVSNRNTVHGVGSSAQPSMSLAEAPIVALARARSNLPDEDSTPTENSRTREQLPFACNISWDKCNRKSIWPHKCSWKTVRNKTDTATIRTKVIDCGFPKCSATFKYVKAFDRHYRTVHIRAAKNLKLDCTVEGCHRVGEEGFTRKDNLTQHLRSVHGEVIPKNPMRFNGLSGLSGWNEPIVVRGQQANIED